MKILIASDVHGSSFAIDEIIKRLKEENADKLVLLGDVYNHGPRNPLPDAYSPKEVISVLNTLNIEAVRGNCDAEVDQMMLNFPIMLKCIRWRP